MTFHKASTKVWIPTLALVTLLAASVLVARATSGTFNSLLSPLPTSDSPVETPTQVSSPTPIGTLRPTPTAPGTPASSPTVTAVDTATPASDNWYDDCLVDPTRYPVQPTYTPRPTYTPAPLPTCRLARINPSPTPYATSTMYPTATPYPIQP